MPFGRLTLVEVAREVDALESGSVTGGASAETARARRLVQGATSRLIVSGGGLRRWRFHALSDDCAMRFSRTDGCTRRRGDEDRLHSMLRMMRTLLVVQAVQKGFAPSGFKVGEGARFAHEGAQDRGNEGAEREEGQREAAHGGR